MTMFQFPMDSRYLLPANCYYYLLLFFFSFAFSLSGCLLACLTDRAASFHTICLTTKALQKWGSPTMYRVQPAIVTKRKYFSLGLHICVFYLLSLLSLLFVFLLDLIIKLCQIKDTNFIFKFHKLCYNSANISYKTLAT